MFAEDVVFEAVPAFKSRLELIDKMRRLEKENAALQKELKDAQAARSKLFEALKVEKIMCKEFEHEADRFHRERDEAREWAEAWRNGVYKAARHDPANGCFLLPWENF